MTLPTAEEVTNMFLYGVETKPTNILDSALLESLREIGVRPKFCAN
ncbi:MAG: hypothetical protein LBU53_03990 [Zoogloeaceae bacterium]|jgi:hypothetical protein|nr:hypothetical protein [Zoogloeaceae bacterium]